MTGTTWFIEELDHGMPDAWPDHSPKWTSAPSRILTGGAQQTVLIPGE